MATVRAFYDTVIFALSLNRSDPDYTACRDLVDVDSTSITWSIVLSAITRGEASLNEYVSQLEQRCALQGVEWIEVPQDEIARALKEGRAVKARLEQAGMQSRDIKQAFAASSAKSRLLITRDRDFCDPKDKRRRGAKRRGSEVRTLLRDALGLDALFPTEALTKLRDFQAIDP